MSLAGCASNPKIASVKEGAAKVFDPPPCAVRATTRIGQRWISETIEGGIAALGWKRPEKVCPPDATAAKAAAPPPAKKPLWRRAIGR